MIGAGFRDGEKTVTVTRGQCRDDQTLRSNHEEADTRMILHAKHAARANREVTLQSLDTDVLVLSVSLFRSLDYPELWFRTGVKDRHRLTLPMLWVKRCVVRSLDSMQSQAVIRLALWLVSGLGTI